MLIRIDRKSRLQHENIEQHLELVCTCAFPLALAVSLLWSIAYVLLGRNDVASGLFILGLLFGGCWLVARRGHISLALSTGECLCLAITIFFCLVYDLPSSGVPRTSHGYFLIVAFVAYVDYQRRPRQLPVAIGVIALACFAVFSSTRLELAFAEPLPDQLRSTIAWLNSAITVSVLVASVLVLQHEFSRNGRISRELSAAIGHGGLELFFQPQVSRTGAVIGAEALLRWNHPKRGCITPCEFIPAALDTGLMPQVGRWVLDEAARILIQWQLREQTFDLVMAVNISADHLLSDDFVDSVTAAIARHGAPARKLKLELTETIFGENVDGLVEKLDALKAKGITIALDDFGTGYSSLGYLRQVPLRQIKVDRSLTRAVGEGPRAAALARNIVQLGHALNLEILAEGIETEEQLRFMMDCGCHAFQGNYFAPALPLSEFRAWIEQRRPMVLPGAEHGGGHGAGALR